MPGTARKSAPRKAAAKKTAPQPAPKVEPAGEASDVFDLLDALGTEEQPPVPVTLLGVNATVRRTFTAAEDLEFTELLQRRRIKDALRILVGDDADALAAKIDGLSLEQGVKVVNRMANISTLFVGEAMALSPTSALRMVGAPATHSSRGSTT